LEETSAVDYGAVRAIFDAADVRAGERQARGEFVGSGFHVDEIFEASCRRFSYAGLQLAVVDTGEVVHADLAVLLVGVEKFAEFVDHGCEIRGGPSWA